MLLLEPGHDVVARRAPDDLQLGIRRRALPCGECGQLRA